MHQKTGPTTDTTLFLAFLPRLKRQLAMEVAYDPHQVATQNMSKCQISMEVRDNADHGLQVIS